MLWPVRTTRGPCSRAMFTGRVHRRHFWTLVNTTRVNTSDTLVTNKAREHGCHDTRVQGREHGR